MVVLGVDARKRIHTLVVSMLSAASSARKSCPPRATGMPRGYNIGSASSSEPTWCGASKIAARSPARLECELVAVGQRVVRVRPS